MHVSMATLITTNTANVCMLYSKYSPKNHEIGVFGIMSPPQLTKSLVANANTVSVYETHASIQTMKGNVFPK